MSHRESLAVFNQIWPRCGECTACCSGGLTIELSEQERATLAAAGTRLEACPPDRPSTYVLCDPANAFYDMKGPCGHLVEDPVSGLRRCALWGRSERPEACERFTEMDDSCRRWQAITGVLFREEYELYVLLSQPDAPLPPRANSGE